MKHNPILVKQLAIDYCLKEENIIDAYNHYSKYLEDKNMRQFEDNDKTKEFKLCIYNNKLLVTGNMEIIKRFNEEINTNAQWFLEFPNLNKLNQLLNDYHIMIDKIHPFYIQDKYVLVDDCNYHIEYYDEKSIKQFKDDKRFNKAYSFKDRCIDVIGVGIKEDDKIIAMAGASKDSDLMYQIGINSFKEGKGLASIAVGLITNEILKMNVLPYYGTAFSHFQSQSVALKNGYRLAFIELTTKRKD